MIRNLFCMVFAAFWTAILFFACALALLLTWNPSSTMWIVQRLWSPGLLWAGGGRLEVLGKENLLRGKPAIYVVNHQSTIDIPAVFMAVDVDFRYVAKKALKYVPFIGWYLAMARFIFIDRGNHREAIASLDKAAAQIRGGTSIVMFAEGTRSDDCRVHPFKKGPFALAMKAQVPLVPVTIEGSGRLMPKNSWVITPGPIKVKIGPPIDPAQFGDNREAMIKAVRDIIIDQSVELGGFGGEKSDAVAARGLEGIGRPATPESTP
jgi:1-acyl-sn-glycerol-3-phosphate acyltransferase